MIHLVTCLDLPEPDYDEAVLLAALEAAGIPACVKAWDDPHAEWPPGHVYLIRSTWNYHRHLDAFLAWVERVERRGKLLNPADIVRWNVHKGYLLKLEKAGIPIAPTELVRRGSGSSLEEILRRRGWTDVVVKPAVSGGSFGTLRTQGAPAGLAHFAGLHHERDLLVQEYLTAVEERGERSMVVIDGRVTHAVRKSPRFLGDEEETVPVEPTAPEIAFAGAVLDVALAGRPELVYARVDVAPLSDGSLGLMELELIEPSLFLGWGVHATPAARDGLDRLVATLRRLL